MPKMGVLRASEGHYFHCFTIKSIGSGGPTPGLQSRCEFRFLVTLYLRLNEL